MIRRLCLALLAAATAHMAVPAQTPPASPAVPPAPQSDNQPGLATPTLDARDVGAWLDGYMPAALKQGKIAGAQVVVVKDGQVIAQKGYGFADVAAATPMDPTRSMMRIGSTSKLFTWTAVMQQVEAGRIDLDADVNRYLDFRITPRSGRAITMRDLMNHRAGFEEGLKDLLATDPKRLKTNEQYLKQNIRPQLFPSGTVPAYSNYGVALAGYIVERVSHEPFDAYVERHILAPLGMRRTTTRQPLPGAFSAFMSKGYTQSDAAPSKFELVTTAPAGSVSATGADMGRFMIALLQQGRLGDTRILRPETARLMFQPTFAAPAGFDTMAHGFFHGRRNGRLVVGHGGDTIVFHTDLNMLPEENVGIFVSFNSRGADNSVYGARERLFDLFMDRYFPAPRTPARPAIADAAAHAAAIAGRYESSRRVETGFISLFYLIQQDQLVANEDGTVSLSSIEDKKFREVVPGLWREVGGARQLLVTQVGGRRAIIDSANPVGILQAVPLARNAVVNQLIAVLSVIVLIATLIAWPASAWLRRRYKLPTRLTGQAARVRLATRVAAAADLLYLGAWYTVLAPILQNRVDAYNDGLDGWIRVLQVAALVPVLGAAVGLWNAALAFRDRRGWGAVVRSVIVALALLGIVWIAWMGRLIGFDLNY
ncbi:serine hydrolase [Sphingomonas sp.]|uniref:serine hydrolase n=1 Tax=Sphingomonas sp. TaxID=28214 RepID=UPI003B3BB96C